MEKVPFAVAQAAMESGVAERPIADMEAYRARLHNQVFRTSLTMKPVFELARQSLRRVAYAEGEEERVLQTVQQVVDQNVARPVVIGRREIVLQRIEELGLKVRPEQHFDLVDPENNPNYEAHCDAFYQRVSRRGYSPKEAAEYVRLSSTVLAATMLHRGDVDAMICGVVGRYGQHLETVQTVVGPAPGVSKLTSMNALVLHSGVYFIADTYVQENPSAEDIAEITVLCEEAVRWFGTKPKAALLSHSNFGSHSSASAQKMQRALELIRERSPGLEIEGEMHADLALSEELRGRRFPDSALKGQANLLIMPNQDAANIAFNMLKVIGNGIIIGPILLGAAGSAHVITPSISVRGLLNMTALAAVRAHQFDKTQMEEHA
jgi:malate dehydrogenase (oxaloacetate-decarboxylating)(NADP+)